MKLLKSFVVALLILLFIIGMLVLIGNHPIIVFSIILVLLFLALWSDLYDSM